MATKTIAITEEVYERLVSLKAQGESFSEELKRLTGSQSGIMDFAGVLSDLSEKEAEKMEEAIRKLRGGTRIRELMERVKDAP